MNQPMSKKQKKQQKRKEKLRQREEEAREHNKKDKKEQNAQNAKKKSKDAHDDTQAKQKHNKQFKNTKNHAQPHKKPTKPKPPKQQNQQQNQSQQQNQDLNFNTILQDQQNLQFAFLISEINEKHYHSMKTILQKFARLTGIMSSEWADAIVGNPGAGNVVVADDADQDDEEEEQNEDDEEEEDEGQEDDEENVCSGVINILPPTHQLTKKLLTKQKQTVTNKEPKYRGPKKPSQLLSSNKPTISLLICQRAINLPPDIIKSMHQVLAGQLSQLRKTKNIEYGKICSNYIFGLSQVEIPKGMRTEDVGSQDLIFAKFEDYLFINGSQCWWIGEGSPNSLRKAPLHKLHYIISTERYFQAVKQIHTLLEPQFQQ